MGEKYFCMALDQGITHRCIDFGNGRCYTDTKVDCPKRATLAEYEEWYKLQCVTIEDFQADLKKAVDDFWKDDKPLSYFTQKLRDKYPRKIRDEYLKQNPVSPYIEEMVKGVLLTSLRNSKVSGT